jgi:aminoglycoside phosphotransferase (APT) family kinase protein
MSEDTDVEAADPRGLDEARERPEDLPLPALRAYLRRAGLPADALVVDRFRDGHSNLTYLLRSGAEEWVLRRRPPGRLPPRAHDMAREFQVLSRLSAAFDLAPRPILYCEDDRVIGAPFYLMERRSGVVLRGLAWSEIPLGDPALPRLCRALAGTLARLHDLDYRALGLEGFGRPEGYLARQVDRWRERYRAVQTDLVPEIEEVAEWLRRHTPPESGASLLHNDYKFDNVVVDPADPSRIVAVLDWEMATIGDPLSDLGMSLGLWIEAGDREALREAWISPACRPDSLTRAELVEIYGECRGAPVSNPVFHYCLGLFRLAVLFQQLYARYRRGDSTDRRLGRFDRTVSALARQAADTLGAGRL